MIRRLQRRRHLRLVQPLSLSQLRARSVIAGDLYAEGKIERHECFRLEMDAFLGTDTGRIKYVK